MICVRTDNKNFFDTEDNFLCTDDNLLKAQIQTKLHF